MSRLAIATALPATALPLFAQPSLPASFRASTIHRPAGTDIFVRSAGHGPVVVLIHGYAENSDSWAPLAADLMRDHTVIVPDLRGIGRSSIPASGYDKKTQASAFGQDAKDNQVFAQTKLTMPVLAIGGEKSFGATEAVVSATLPPTFSRESSPTQATGLWRNAPPKPSR